MSSGVSTQPRTSPTQDAGRKGNKARGRGAANNNRGGGFNRAHHKANANANATQGALDTTETKATGPTLDVAPKFANQIAPSESGEMDICWICAEQVKYYAVSECNHRTCHVCALRLRALYKKLECTFCKVGCLLRPLDFHVNKNTSAIRKRRMSSYSPRLPMRCSLRIPRNRSRIRTRGCLYPSRRWK